MRRAPLEQFDRLALVRFQIAERGRKDAGTIAIQAGQLGLFVVLGVRDRPPVEQFAQLRRQGRTGGKRFPRMEIRQQLLGNGRNSVRRFQFGERRAKEFFRRIARIDLFEIVGNFPLARLFQFADRADKRLAFREFRAKLIENVEPVFRRGALQRQKAVARKEIARFLVRKVEQLHLFAVVRRHFSGDVASELPADRLPLVDVFKRESLKFVEKIPVLHEPRGFAKSPGMNARDRAAEPLVEPAAAGRVIARQTRKSVERKPFGIGKDSLDLFYYFYAGHLLAPRRLTETVPKKKQKLREVTFFS